MIFLTFLYKVQGEDHFLLVIQAEFKNSARPRFLHSTKENTYYVSPFTGGAYGVSQVLFGYAIQFLKLMPLCGSKKYPYLPQGWFFGLDPPTPWDFQSTFILSFKNLCN